MRQPEDDQGTFAALRQNLARLRGPGGCPWDREQTHASLRHPLLEECYEALDALDSGNPQELTEELGDILLQVALHCQIAQEAGEFTYEEVFHNINQKLLRRHPHVFGDVKLDTVRQVEERWQVIKEEEREGRSSLLDGVSPSMPALAHCQAISHRAARAGFEWDNLQGVLAKVAEELQELGKAGSQEEREHEFGDVFFSLVNVARWLGIDAEGALRQSNRRFYKRFGHMEQTAQQKGTTFTGLSMPEKEALWQGAKEQLG